jgi:ATP-dependent Clp protease ATP-binding subunit ClpA
MHFNFLGDEEGVPIKDVIKNNETPSKYNMADLQRIRKNIEKDLIGQEEAVEKMFNMFKLVNSGFESYGSAFFIGPTGVGKTHIANLIAEHYMGSNKRILKINCSEYAGPHEYAKLIGSPPGYVGSNEPGILASKAEESSQWVILFDEIEKADSKLHNLLLGFLDDGYITDNKGNMLDFSNSLFLFTSNVGIHDNVGRKNVGFEGSITTYDDAKEPVMEAFKSEFSPEFINRIDEIIFFNQLTIQDAENITKLNLRNLPIKITKKLVSHIVDNAYSPEYGARNIKRYIKQHVTLKLADKILNGSKADKFKPKFQQGKLKVEEI